MKNKNKSKVKISFERKVESNSGKAILFSIKEFLLKFYLTKLMAKLAAKQYRRF